MLSSAALGQPSSPGLERVIPSSGERVPALGMGTWITFDVQGDRQRATRVDVLRDFFGHGGRLIDSSPMYGRSPDVVGHCLDALGRPRALLAASKVWTSGPDQGAHQLERSAARWGVPGFDIVQIHNMLDWRRHLPMLRDKQSAGELRYVGITTSHGRRHEALREALSNEHFDIVQFTYNIAEREVENVLLPLAADRGVAVIVNRPFATGRLFARVRNKGLPGWARELDCRGWAEAFLKFVLSHPAVTTAIPATSQPGHMRENMRALHGPLPDAALRRRMIADFEKA